MPFVSYPSFLRDGKKGRAWQVGLSAHPKNSGQIGKCNLQTQINPARRAR